MKWAKERRSLANYSLHESLGFIIAMAGRAITNEVQWKFREGGFNVTPEHWTILVQLWNHDGLTQGELAERTGKDEPCVSRLIRNMLTRGLIIRKSDPQDGRKKRIYLTEQMKQEKDALIGLVQQTLAEATKGVGEEDVETAKNVLKRIALNLN